MEDSGPIIVGHDGSDFADEALRKGLWLADKLDATVRIVRAWTISNAPRPKSWAPGYVPPVEDFAEAVLEQLKGQVAERVAQAAGVKVEYAVPHGAAGRELIKATEGARLIVVGTRGLGGFAGLLLGSVSDQVVEHAQCDVLVTRRAEGDQSPARQQRLDWAIEPDETQTS